uniref:Uncharacterized protein n=1 Tax=Physcomitrium patens TaxID=3218 RepID=A0A7I3YUW4_PHYPA
MKWESTSNLTDVLGITREDGESSWPFVFSCRFIHREDHARRIVPCRALGSDHFFGASCTLFRAFADARIENWW